MDADDLLDDPVYNPDIAIGRWFDLFVVLFSYSFQFKSFWMKVWMAIILSLVSYVL